MKKIFGLLVCAVVACLSLQAQSSAEKQHLRLLYWNIQNGMWSGQDDNYAQWVDWVKAQNPDVCVWCEGQSIWKNGSTEALPKEQRYLVDGWGELAARYGHSYVYVGGHRDSYPQVITSRLPIENVSRIVGNDADSVVCHGAGWATVKFLDKTINIVTLHTWPQAYTYGATDRTASAEKKEGNLYRRMEIEYICRHTILSHDNAKNECWMMMGDFNSITSLDNHQYRLPRSSSDFFVNDYVVDNTPYVDVINAFHPKQYIPSMGKKHRRIDFVYLTPALLKHAVRADIIWDDYTTPVRALDSDGKQLSNFWHPSDHLPVIVDFEF